MNYNFINKFGFVKKTCSVTSMAKQLIPMTSPELQNTGSIATTKVFAPNRSVLNTISRFCGQPLCNTSCLNSTNSEIPSPLHISRSVIPITSCFGKINKYSKIQIVTVNNNKIMLNQNMTCSTQQNSRGLKKYKNSQNSPRKKTKHKFSN